MTLSASVSNTDHGLLETLITLAAAASNMTPDAVAAELGSPRWQMADKCHDWRNHVDEDLKPFWTELPMSARIVAFLHAWRASQSEEWD